MSALTPYPTTRNFVGPDLQALKGVVSFSAVVAETHDIDRSGNCLCPAHNDSTPSFHVYDDHGYCFACGFRADHITWSEQVRGLSTAEAIAELQRRANGSFPTATSLHQVPSATPQVVSRLPLSTDRLERHLEDILQLVEVPTAMLGRGFNFDELQRLGFAAYGGDAVFPILGPTGDVIALKRRYAEPGNGPRYRYTTQGCGVPAWCSLGLHRAAEVLIIEGELNAMACWLAYPERAAMGVAGTNGTLHLEALKGRTVYCYGDADEPGQKARDRWAQQAIDAGASEVFVLKPWSADACEIAGQQGRDALRELLS